MYRYLGIILFCINCLKCTYNIFINEVQKLKEIHRIMFFYNIFGSKEEDEVASFFVYSPIRMRGYSRLGKG